MNLKQIEKDTIKYPFLSTLKSEDAHFCNSRTTNENVWART
ncbi:hypothetical protein [Wolbachia endosymbiont (group B) of Gerris lacustris]